MRHLRPLHRWSVLLLLAGVLLTGFTPAPCAAAAGRRLAVVIGVEHYEHGYIQLDYAADDAKRLARALEKLGYEVNLQAVDGNTGGGIPRKLAVTALQNAVAAAQEEDTLVFFFAGHGSRRGGQDYLLFSDSDPDKLTETALPIEAGEESLRSILGKCRAKQRLLILDACRSSATRAGGTSGFAEGGLAKGFKERLDRVVRQAPSDVKPLSAVMYSCQPGESARESDAERGGLFTVRLARALEAGIAQVRNLDGYLKQRFPKEVHQTPTVEGDGDLDLGDSEEERELRQWLQRMVRVTRSGRLAELQRMDATKAREVVRCPYYKDVRTALNVVNEKQVSSLTYIGEDTGEAERRYLLLAKCFLAVPEWVGQQPKALEQPTSVSLSIEVSGWRYVVSYLQTHPAGVTFQAVKL